MRSPPKYRPGEPVCESGVYAAITLDGHSLGEGRFYPAGTTFPPRREHGVRYVRIGLPGIDSM